MPFKSEAQRRYMHANLPEIAQRWEQEYSTGGIASQGGMKNYLGEQPMVNAPKYWQSAPDHEMTELAYITPRERDVLVDMNMYGSMQGSPNEGPSGIMSLNGWGSKDESQNVSGAAASAAESGRNTADTLAEGMSHQDVKDFQAGAVAAGAGQRVNPGFFDSRNTVSPEVLARAKAFAPDAYSKHRGGFKDFISGGGILGNLVRGVGQKLGWGKTYDQPTYDMSGYNSLGLGGTGQEGFGVPNFESGDGDYDMLGNKIDEITGEITSPEGQSLGFLEGYPGQKSGITTIPTGDGGSDDYVKLVEKYIQNVADPELNDSGFEWRFGQNKSADEVAATNKAMNKKIQDWGWTGRIGLGDMDGS